MKLIFCVAAVAVVACGIPKKPSAAIRRTGTSVNAPAQRTWDAVVALYGDQNLPIQTMDLAAGQIVGGASTVTDKIAKPERYDCGTGVQGTNPARRVFYNAVVRGDSTRSTVQMTARWETWVGGTLANSWDRPVQGGWDAERWKAWVGGDVANTWECTTQGERETEFESQVRARAEGR